jgi:hypothetical protein
LRVLRRQTLVICVVMGCRMGLVTEKCSYNHARNFGLLPSPRPGCLARGDSGGKGGAAIAERRRRRPCGRRHHVDDYWPRGRLYPAYRPARSPRAPSPASTGNAAELTRRNALATSSGFSILLDIRRPGDGPEIDLARWGCVASRRSGAARPYVSPGAALDGIGACVVWLCPRADVW